MLPRGTGTYWSCCSRELKLCGWCQRSAARKIWNLCSCSQKELKFSEVAVRSQWITSFNLSKARWHRNMHTIELLLIHVKNFQFVLKIQEVIQFLTSSGISFNLDKFQRWADCYFGPLVRCPADYRNVSRSAPADYRNWASASPLLNYLREVFWLISLIPAWIWITYRVFKRTVQRDLFGWKWYHLIDPT